jgi:hypothetical protein
VNPFEFVLGIILLSGIFAVIRHAISMKAQTNGGDTAEAKQLRAEVGELKERIKVLERIAVDKENALAKEIESLRDT